MAFNAVNTSGSWLDVGNRSTYQFDRTQAWSGITWIKMASAPSTAAVVFTTANQGPGPNTSYATSIELFINSSCNLQMRIISTIVFNNYIGGTGSVNICDGEWHKIAAGYDGSSTVAGMSMSVDNLADTITSEGHSISGSSVNGQVLTIGGQYGYPYSLGATIAHLSISNIVRSQAWIDGYTTAAASLDANTILALDFPENSGKTTLDGSSNAYSVLVDNVTWEPSGSIGANTFISNDAVGPDTGATVETASTATLPTNVVSGDTVVGAVYCACSTALTVSDDKSNSYTVIGPETSLAGVRYWIFYAVNVTNGPHAITGTLTTGTGTFWRIVVNELTNVTTNAPDQTPIIGYNNVVSGTDSVTSGSITTAINNDLIFGVANSYTAPTMKAGTNFSLRDTVVAASGDSFWTEYLQQPAAGSVAATLTPSIATKSHAGIIGIRTQ